MTKHVISKCHVCQEPCDNHRDCNNDACHILFIQCARCKNKLNGCCSIECKNFALLPYEDQKKLRKNSKKLFQKHFLTLG